jgi:transposase
VDLTEEQWEVLAPLIPEPPRRTDGRGRPWRDPRDVPKNGILWVFLRTGAPWHDLPERYPPYQTCHRRFQRWTEEGVLEEVLQALAEDLKERGGLDLSECFVDGTFVGAKRGRIGGKDQAGQGYEAHGVGRPLWPSSRRARGECFAARGHARRSDARACLGAWRRSEPRWFLRRP